MRNLGSHLSNAAARVAAIGRRVLPNETGETFGIPLRLAWAKVTGGDGDTGWTVAMMNWRNGDVAASNFRMAGSADDAKLFTWPQGESLSVGQEVPILFGRPGALPLIWILNRNTLGIECAVGRMSGLHPENLTNFVDGEELNPFNTQFRWFIDFGAGPRYTYYETLAGSHFGTAWAGLRLHDYRGVQPGDPRIIHDRMTAAMWPFGALNVDVDGHPWPKTMYFPDPGPPENHDGNVILARNDVFSVFEDVDSDPYVKTQIGLGHMWGTPFLWWMRWNPRMGQTIYRRVFEATHTAASGTLEIDFDGYDDFRPIARSQDRDAGRDFSQVPFGGQTYEVLALTRQNSTTGEYEPLPEVGGDPNTIDYSATLSPPKNPVWVCSTCVRPVVYPFKVFPSPTPTYYLPLRTAALRETNGVTYMQMEQAPVMSEVSVFWHDPTHAENYKPHVVWGDWNAQVDMDPVTKPYWMGCGNYNPFNQAPYTAFPNNLEGVWAPAAGWTSRALADRTINFAAGRTDWSSHSDRAPGIKIDGGAQVPGFQFRAPKRLRKLVEEYGAENVSIVSSTADVRVDNVQRTEYWLECYNRAAAWSLSTIFSGANNFVAGNIYGPLLRQLSHPGTSAADWKSIYQDRWQQATTSESRNGSQLSTNTHVRSIDWTTYVQGETGVTLSFDYVPGGGGEYYRLPDLVPKQPPFYPAGTTGAPEAVTPLQGAKLGHWLIGMQADGAISGTGSGDKTCKPTLDAFAEFRAFGVNYDDIPGGLREQYDDTQNGYYRLPPGTEDDSTRYDWPWAQASRDEDILDWIRTAKGGTIAGLENIAYRALGFARPFPEADPYYGQVVPDGAWTSVSMKEVAELLRDDALPETKAQSWSTEEAPATFTKDHTAYRIVPGFPWTRNAAVAHATIDGLPRNITPWACSFMPAGIEPPDTPGDPSANLFGRWPFVIFGIVFQAFDSWKMRNWEIVVEYPGGEEGALVQETIRIATPWG